MVSSMESYVQTKRQRKIENVHKPYNMASLNQRLVFDHFLFFLRPARVPSTSRFLNPYVVCFVVVAGVVILAVTVALLIHFLAFGKY